MTYLTERQSARLAERLADLPRLAKVAAAKQATKGRETP